MKLKVLVVDFELSTRAKRWITRIAAAGLVLVGGIAAADGGGLVTWTSGQQLSSAALNANFAAVSTPPGTVVAFAGPVTPSGWLLCDGSAVSRTAYAALFTAIGTTGGSGDGASTFTLPNYQGMFLRGLDSTGNIDPDATSRTQAASGGNQGALVGTIEDDEFQAHGHNVENGMDALTQGYDAGGTFFQTFGDGTHNAGRVLEPTMLSGYGAPRYGKETRPKNVAVNFIVKY